MVIVTSEDHNQRIPVLGAVECQSSDDSPHQILSMLDLGEGGIFVQTSYPLDTGTEILVRFDPGDAPEEIVVRARVIWSRPGPEGSMPTPGMGLKFIDIKDEYLERIRRIITMHNEYARHYSTFNSLPDDAMRFSPPKVNIQIPETQHLSGNLISHNAAGMHLTVALPFLKTGQKIICDGPNGQMEEGRISWLKFEPENVGGIPSVKMGIEFSLESWGEEIVRRSTQPLQCWHEEEEGIFESEEMSSTSTTDYVPPPPTDGVSSSINPDLQPESSEKNPVCNFEPAIEKNKIEDFNRKYRESGNTIPELSSEMRFPAPMVRNDTFPIAGVKSPWPLTKLATGIVLIAGIIFFGYGAWSSGSSGKVASEPNDSELAGMINGNMAIPYEKGTPYPVKVVHNPTVKTISEPEVKTSENKSPTLLKKENSVRALSAKLNGKIKQISIPLGGSAGRISHYFLASPPGIVIDTTAKSELLKGIHSPDRKILRKVKVIKKKNGERFILYTFRKPAKVRVKSSDGYIRVSYN
ncbi:MAG: PilZ domain-containing protein [Deltaproteobacteria bacterium]|nr:PilZ domain-containing protein [Deltaproteobacteria bacterium]